MPNLKSEIRNLKSRAFTLLEVMLALVLVSLVLVAVAIAIDVHLRVLDTGRSQVEEAQLARALLRRIADDLRSAVQYQPVDVSKMMPQSSAAAAAENATGIDVTAALSGAAKDAGIDPVDVDWGDLDDDEQSDPTSDLAGSLEPPTMPGLYGNVCELQVDTSRLPRIDQFNGMLSASADSPATQRPTDVKTVTYYVLENLLSSVADASDGSSTGGGLVRREMDRATAAYATHMGQLTESDYDQGPIAPEVVGIQFLYFDGTDVVEEWNSQERGGLPLAVEITLYIRPERFRDASLGTLQTAAAIADDEQLAAYRLLVHLPAAKPTTLEDTLEGSSDGFSEEQGTAAGSGSGTGEGGSR